MYVFHVWMKSFSIFWNISNLLTNDFAMLLKSRYYFHIITYAGIQAHERIRESVTMLLQRYNVTICELTGDAFHGFWFALRCLVNDTLEASSTNLFLSGLFRSALKWLNLCWSIESCSPEKRTILCNHSFNDNYVPFWQVVCMFHI